MKSRGGSGLRKRFWRFFLYSYVALVSPKKARFILGSFASETDKSHLLEGGGCFFFSSHPWDLFVFFCDVIRWSRRWRLSLSNKIPPWTGFVGAN